MRVIRFDDNTEITVTEDDMAACPQVAALRERYAEQRAKTAEHCGTPGYAQWPNVCSFCLVRHTQVNKATCGHGECEDARRVFFEWAKTHLKAHAR